MKDQLREYWQSRSPRDRRIILAISAVAALAILYAYVWMPMEKAREDLRKEIPRLRAEVAQMALQAQEITRLKAAPAPLRGAPQEMINQSAVRAGIKGELGQVTPLSAERIQVTLTSVAFDRWIGWTKALAVDTGLRVESAQVTAAGEPGMVKVQAVLAVPGR